MKILSLLILLSCCPVALCETGPVENRSVNESRATPLLSLASGPAGETPYFATTGRLWSAHVSYVVGYKGLESKWRPARDHLQYGIADADFQPPNFPFSFAAQILASYSDDVPDINGVIDDFSNTFEANIGVRKIFNNSGQIAPFIGGGLSILGASTTTDDRNSFEREDSDTGLGFWVSAGFYWHFADHWHVGAEGEYSYGRVHLFGDKLNAGGWHALLMFGYHW